MVETKGKNPSLAHAAVDKEEIEVGGLEGEDVWGEDADDVSAVWE